MFSISKHRGKTYLDYVERRTISIRESRNKACFGFAERKTISFSECKVNLFTLPNAEIV